MKTGKAAQLFGVDPKTILNWLAMPQLASFFSEGSQLKPGRTQRDLSEGDILILNTIHALRTSGVFSWDEIAQRLHNGELVTTLPANILTVDTGGAPIYQYANMLAVTVERDRALVEIAQLKADLVNREQMLEQLRLERDAQKEQLLREMSDMRGSLQREIGKLEGQVEIYKAQLAALAAADKQDEGDSEDEVKG